MFLYPGELTSIARSYVSTRYNIQALEQTSGELINTLKNSRIAPASNIEQLEQALFLSDNVKFAKYNPIEQEHNLSLENLRLFIHQTKQIANDEF